MRKHRLITDGNAVYEVDLDCLRERFEGMSGWQSEEDRYDIPEETGTGQGEAGFRGASQTRGFSARERLEQMKRYTHRTLRLQGKGVGIAVLDTGADPHPDFKKRIIGFYDPVGGRQAPYDDHGHGTHVCGILAGDGTASGGRYVGMAPQAGLYVVKVLDEQGEGMKRVFLKGCEHILQVHREKGIRAVNVSIGALAATEEDESSEMVWMLNRLWDAGLVVCVAAGNGARKDRIEGSVTVLGTSRKIITVGSSDDEFPVNLGKRTLRDYSGCGPTKGCIMKPEIVAPGYRIVAAHRLQGKAGGLYAIRSGTSMAAPAVCGAVALLLGKEPERKNTEVKLRLRDTATDLGRPISKQGWGELNLQSFLQGKT